MLKAFLIFLLVLVTYVKYTDVLAPSLLVVEEKNQDFVVLKISDLIIRPLASDLEGRLSDLSLDRGVILVLNSQGGSVKEGRKLMRILQKYKDQGLHINTLVKNGSVCASMCIPVFMQGEKRYAGARASFMLHGVYLGLQRKNPNEAKSKAYVSSLIQAGVNKDWLSGLWDKNIFTEPKEYWLNAEELFNQGSNIVTDVTPNLVTYQPNKG